MEEKDFKRIAKVAYLYYIKNKSQSEISEELGIYRTTISRMLKLARDMGIVKIEIKGFDTEVFRLENYVKEKYHLKSVDIVANNDIDQQSLDEKIALVAAQTFRSLLFNNCNVGVSWGKTLSKVVDAINPKVMKNIHFYPLTGGPSKINVHYHVNTLVYTLANKFQGNCSLVNATVVQESVDLANGIVNSKYFEEIRSSWQNLDVALVGIGGKVEESKKHWLDMLTRKDFDNIHNSDSVGEICCRFLTRGNQKLISDLSGRTIAISLLDLKKIKDSVAVAYGLEKAEAILCVLKNLYVNHLVTDYDTMVRILELDNDFFVENK